jgi:hypothetical protein
MENDIQQRTMDFQLTVILNKSELAESVHEKADP